MTGSSVWDVLGIEPTGDRDQIRRAYTRKLKVTNPEDDPAAFQQLRQAYEVALRLLAGGYVFETSDVEDQDAPDTSADVPDAGEVATIAAPEAAIPPAVLQVREDYGQLSELLGREDGGGAAALQLFAKICAAPALEDVSLRIELEKTIAALLLRHMPRSAEVLSRAAQAFGWSAQRARVGSAPAIVAAGECADNLAYVAQLRSGNDALSPAFRALTTPPVGWRLRIRILVSGLDRQVNKVLHALRFERASAATVLNPAAVEWWTAYFAQPRLSRPMVLATLVVPLGVAWWTGAPLQWPADRVWTTVLAALLAMIVATVGKLFLVDWGRIRFGERFGRDMPAWNRVGWLPLALLLAIVAGLGLPLWPVSALCVLWAWYSRPELYPGQQRRSTILAIYFNLPMAVWLGLFAIVLPVPVVLTIAGAACAHMAGQLTLGRIWRDIAPSVRARTVAMLLIVAIVLSAVLIVMSRERQLYGLFAALAVSVVLLQRTAVETLTEKQLKTRYHVSWISIFGAAIGAASLDEEAIAVVLSSLWFLLGTAVGLVMALVNEARHAGARRR